MKYVFVALLIVIFSSPMVTSASNHIPGRDGSVFPTGVPVNSGTPNPATDSGTPNPATDSGNPNPAAGSSLDPTGGGSVTIKNPLGDKTLMEFFTDILSVIFVFAVPLIVFFIIYAGFMYVIAQGKPDEIKTASRALLYAIIGGLIILGAWIILEVIEGTINAFTG